MNVCSMGGGGASPDTGEQLSASGGSLCPELAELSRPAASDPREPGPWQLREGDRRGYLVFLGKLHRQECRTTAIGELGAGIIIIITLLSWVVFLSYFSSSRIQCRMMSFTNRNVFGSVRSSRNANVCSSILSKLVLSILIFIFLSHFCLRSLLAVSFRSLS